MRKGDKRGISTVIASLLIILLIAVAVAIVWGVIKNMITQNSELVSLGKFTIDLEIVAVSQTGQGTVVKVKRNTGAGELDGIYFSILDEEGNTHVFEKRDVDLDQLETKTFILDYWGQIISISVYPIFLTEAGTTSIGNVLDTYNTPTYGGGTGGGYIDPDCEPDCEGKECGDNGCGESCGDGCSGATPYCLNGECVSDIGSITPDCSCSSITCVGRTCDDGLGGSCMGTMVPDCEDEYGTIQCGAAENLCGGPSACGECEEGLQCSFGMCCPPGYYGSEGTCKIICVPDCTGRECGESCGVSCGYGDCKSLGDNYFCNETYMCEECIKDCTGRECGPSLNGCPGSCGDCATLYDSSYHCNMDTYQCEQCIPECGERECGPTINGCGESCGDCSTLGPTYTCNISFKCHNELLNTGYVYSYWPSPVGRMLFDSPDLPKSSSIDYEGEYIKFPESVIGEKEYGICLTILDFVTPINPLVYDKSYAKISESPRDIDVGDYYEIWGNYTMCCEDYCIVG